MNHQSHQIELHLLEEKSKAHTNTSRGHLRKISGSIFICFLVWKYGSFITLFPSTHVERLYIITREEVSVNTQYFPKHLIFLQKSIQQFLKVEVLGQKGSFSLSCMQPIKDTNPKKLNIQTLPMTHIIRKLQRFRL